MADTKALSKEVVATVENSSAPNYVAGYRGFWTPVVVLRVTNDGDNTVCLDGLGRRKDGTLGATHRLATMLDPELFAELCRQYLAAYKGKESS